jgi:hypothetical protein
MTRMPNIPKSKEAFRLSTNFFTFLKGLRWLPLMACASCAQEPVEGVYTPAPEDEIIDFHPRTLEETAKCLKDVKRSIAFKDSESVRVEGDGTAVTQKSGQTTIVINLNAQNSYGAYVGPKPYVCRYDEKDNLIYAVGLPNG